MKKLVFAVGAVLCAFLAGCGGGQLSGMPTVGELPGWVGGVAVTYDVQGRAELAECKALEGAPERKLLVVHAGEIEAKEHVRMSPEELAGRVLSEVARLAFECRPGPAGGAGGAAGKGGNGGQAGA